MLMYLRQLGSIFIFTLSLGALAVVAAPSAQLQNFNTKIEQAREDGATILAPITLRLAEVELRRAHQMVRDNSSNALSVEHALEMADYRVEELRRVLNLIHSAGFKMAEEMAIRQVREAYPQASPTISKHEAVD